MYRLKMCSGEVEIGIFEIFGIYVIQANLDMTVHYTTDFCL